MKRFSQRKGFAPVRESIQRESISTESRNLLWNVLDAAIWSHRDFVRSQYDPLYKNQKFDNFSWKLWHQHFREPVDRRPEHPFEIITSIRKHFFECEWYEVYDFLEFIVRQDDGYGLAVDELTKILNRILTRELSAYRIVSGVVTDITDEAELEMLEQALEDDRFAGVASHLASALDLYSDRAHPDYRNSIKESISAVESMARIVSGNPKATLGDALKTIAARGTLHTSLKEGFLKLYGYTSDEGGIRHAMMDEPNITDTDARYFLLSCTSFVNYLKAQVA